MVKTATNKMIVYAKSISRTLDIPEPDFNDYSLTSEFIKMYELNFKDINVYDKNKIFMDKIDFVSSKYNLTFDFGKIKQNNSSKIILILWYGNRLDDIILDSSYLHFIKEHIDNCLSSNFSPSFTHISIIEFDNKLDAYISYLLLRSKYGFCIEADGIFNTNDKSVLYSTDIDVDELEKFEVVTRRNIKK